MKVFQRHCNICWREHRGLGFSLGLKGIRNMPDAMFCSKSCQDFYISETKGGMTMIDPTDLEKAALRACLRPMGEIVAEIGMNKPLAAYTQDEVITVIDVVVTAYQDAMRSAAMPLPSAPQGRLV